MRVFIALLALAALMPVAPALAADCSNPTTQMAMTACADQTYRQADQQLNTAYQAIMARLKGDAATAKLLTVAQKSWIGFRDGECEFATASSMGGSMHQMSVLGCREKLTKRRVADLQTYLHCEDGDDTCPVPAAP